MILVIDVGNTNIVFGIYENDILINHWRLRTDKHKTTDEYAINFCDIFFFSNINREEIKGIIISSVVPPVQVILERMCKKYFHINPITVSPGIKTGMSIHIENPKELGADRIVNAVAGYSKYKKACIIVDFGTATTFDYVNSKGIYEGGVISPGLVISLDALAKNTSKLPTVEIQKATKVVATNTINAIQSGIYYGYIGLVDGILKRIKKEKQEDCVVIATGGLSKLIALESEEIDYVEEFLTLEGLKILYKKNA